MFKRLFTIGCLLFLLSLSTFSHAFPVTFVWDANPATEEITSYTPYLDGQAKPAVTGTTVTLDIPQGTHIFNVTARNILGESPKSTDVRIPNPPSTPVNVRVSVTVTVNVP